MSEVERLSKQLADAEAHRQRMEADYRTQSRRAELLTAAANIGKVPPVYLDAVLSKLGPDDEFDANALAQQAHERAVADATSLVGSNEPTKQKTKTTPPQYGTPHREPDLSSMSTEEILAKGRQEPKWYAETGKRELDKRRLGVRS